MHLQEPRSTTEWEAYYDLRHRILREPWGQAKGSEVDPSDTGSTNRMIVSDEGRTVAVGRLHLNSPTEAQVRYMAVDTESQGMGLGRMMMNELEQVARMMGAQELMLEARENALDFYRRLGYAVEKKSYRLFGCIQHYTMRKTL